MGHKLQLILKSKLQASPTWDNLVPIPNAEGNTITHCHWKTITYLMADNRKFCGTTCILHILHLGMYFTITL
jgi:hypothetical protein